MVCYECNGMKRTAIAGEAGGKVTAYGPCPTCGGLGFLPERNSELPSGEPSVKSEGTEPPAKGGQQ